MKGRAGGAAKNELDTGAGCQRIPSMLDFDVLP